MKLRSKKTGEIVEVESCNSISGTIGLFFAEGRECDRAYSSLAELNEEWEDYEEPKDIWWLDNEGGVNHATSRFYDSFEKNREIGNFFKTKEDAEFAVEKLKAWKRLKDKGFRFKTWGWENEKSNEYTIWFELNDKEGDCSDLELLFGGKE